MKRFIALGALALCLLSGTAMADKARNIASDADSQYHAAHLENHLDTTDVYCTVNNLRVRNQINGQKVLADLRRFCKASVPTADVNNVHTTYLLEGRREVFLRIVSMLQLTDEDVVKLIEDYDNE